MRYRPRMENCLEADYRLQAFKQAIQLCRGLTRGRLVASGRMSPARSGGPCRPTASKQKARNGSEHGGGHERGSQSRKTRRCFVVI
jgi:hypothetical protein